MGYDLTYNLFGNNFPFIKTLPFESLGTRPLSRLIIVLIASSASSSLILPEVGITIPLTSAFFGCSFFGFGGSAATVLASTTGLAFSSTFGFAGSGAAAGTGAEASAIFSVEPMNKKYVML